MDTGILFDNIILKLWGERMIDKGDIVKIDFSVLDFPEDILNPIKEFDKEYNGLHMVSFVYEKGLYVKGKKPIRRIELDNLFVFYEEELIFIK